MKTNTKLLISGLLACGGVLVACGDSSGTGGAGGAASTVTASVTTGPGGPTTTSTHASTTGVGSTTSTGSGGGFPAPPTLGTQIDRMGRPAINTALNETFLAGATPGPSTDPVRGAAQDAYNADKDPTHWATAYVKTFAEQLAVLDALDAPDGAVGPGCGNQVTAGGTAGTSATAYNFIAGVLTNDQIWVSTAATTTCTTYLGLEFAALGVTISDCGGRRPGDDVIKTTYTLVSGIQAATGFDDGITDTSKHQATFPFLVDPN